MSIPLHTLRGRHHPFRQRRGYDLRGFADWPHPIGFRSLQALMLADKFQVSTGGSRQFTAANLEFFNSTDDASWDQTTNDFAIVVWAYLDSLGITQSLVTKGSAGASLAGYRLRINNSNKANAFISDGSTSVEITSTTTLLANAWYFVVVNFDRDGNASLFINNGAAEGTASIAALDGNSIAQVNRDFAVGGTYDPTIVHHMNGRIGPWGIWTRVLTAAERTQLWNVGRGISFGALDAGLKTGLLDWCNMNGSAGNEVTDHRGLTLTDNATVTAANGPGAGKARQYTKANDEWHSIADNASLSIGDVDMAIATWIYLDNTSSEQIVLSKHAGTSAREYMLYFGNGSSLPRWLVSSDGSTAVEVNAGASIGTATWAFLYVQHDAAADQIAISLNGGALTTGAHTGGIFDGTNDFRIGRRNAAAIDARICRTGIWKGRVLSASEITQLYNNAEGLVYSGLSAGLKTSLVSWWNGDELSGNLVDQHGSNNLTDNNTVTSNEGPESAVVTGVADGDTVSQVTGVSPLKTFFTQNTAPAKPVWKEKIVFGKDVVRFDGVDDFLKSTLAATATATVLIVIAKGNTSLQVLFGSHASRSLALGASSVLQFDKTEAAATQNIGTVPNETGFHVYSLARPSHSSLTVFADMRDLLPGAFDPSDQLGNYAIGARNDAGLNPGLVDWAALIVYSDNKRAETRRRIGYWLAQRYGINDVGIN
jgi:hypothetical protein